MKKPEKTFTIEHTSDCSSRKIIVGPTQLNNPCDCGYPEFVSYLAELQERVIQLAQANIRLRDENKSLVKAIRKHNLGRSLQ